jgi:hypothetical protein
MRTTYHLCYDTKRKERKSVYVVRALEKEQFKKCISLHILGDASMRCFLVSDNDNDWMHSYMKKKYASSPWIITVYSIH